MIQAPMPPMPPTPNFDPDLFFMGDGPKMVLMAVLAALVAATIILWPIMRALLGVEQAPRSGGETSWMVPIRRLEEPCRMAELERLDFTDRPGRGWTRRSCEARRDQEAFEERRRTFASDRLLARMAGTATPERLHLA